MLQYREWSKGGIIMKEKQRMKITVFATIFASDVWRYNDQLCLEIEGTQNI